MLNRLSNQPELLDGPLDPAALRLALRDLGRVNRWLGGTDLSRRAVRAVRLMRRNPGDPLKLLDVGTGLADIPLALLRGADRAGEGLEIEAVDSRPEVIEVARAAIDAADRRRPGGAGRQLRLAVADARALPYPDAAFDVAHTSLMAHHLEPDELAACLVELRRVVRLAIIMNDLDRNRFAYLGAWLLSRLLTRSPLTRHDGPLSVRRAYRRDELTAIAHRVGLVDVARFRHFSGYRYAIVLVPVDPHDR